MEMNPDTKKEENPTKIKKRSNQQYRVVLNENDNSALENLTHKINEGFEYGEINKSDVANWWLANLEKKVSTSEINAIREANFDESKALERILKNAKYGSQKLPPEIASALKNHLGLPRTKKK